MRTLRQDTELIHESGSTRCRVYDRIANGSYEFGSVECLLLGYMQDGLDELQMLAGWNARTNESHTLDELHEFFALLDSWGLLVPNEAASAPVLVEAQSDDPRSRHPDELVAARNEAASQSAGRAGGDAEQPNRWHLFDPRPLLDILCHWTCWLGRLVWLTPALVLVGVLGVAFNLDLVQADVSEAMTSFGLFGRLLFVAFTVNLFSQIVRGLVARNVGADAPSFGVLLLLGLIPRFNIQVLPNEPLPERARAWLFSASIITRLGLFGVSIVLWLSIRPAGSLLSSVFIELAFLSALGLLFIANPLWPSDGYQLFSLWLRTPNLREQAGHILRGTMSGTPSVIKRHSHHRFWLGLYAVLSYLFVVAFVGFIMALVGLRLEEHYQGAGVVLFLLLLFYVAWNVVRQRRARHRAAPRHRGRSPANAVAAPPHRSMSRPTEGRLESATPNPLKANRRRPSRKWVGILITGLAVVTIGSLPYRYDPGGGVAIEPRAAHEINAETEGLVEDVLARGGEWLPKGAVVARLADHRQRKDVLATAATIAAKKQEIAVLQGTPSTEEIALAQQQLETAQLQLVYSSEEAERMRKLYEKRTVSLQLYDDAREAMDLDRQMVAERQASLASLKARVNPSQIAVLEMEVASLQEQQRFYEEQLRRTQLRMPIDGRITTLNLQNLRNAYLEEGDVFAEVEDNRRVLVEIRVPEAEISHVEVGNPVSLRVQAFPHRVFHGSVTEIGLTADDAGYGQVITVLSEIDNREADLASGMTGFAKIQGTSMPLAFAFTQALSRFVRIELWSWIP